MGTRLEGAGGGYWQDHGDASGRLLDDAQMQRDATNVYALGRSGLDLGIGALSGMRSATPLEGAGPYMARGLIGMGITAAGDYMIDRAFGDTPIRGGSFAADFAVTPLLAFSPLPGTVKVPGMLLAHLSGRLLDKYAK